MFDLLFLVVVGVSTAFAVLRGGLRELSTLLALAIAGGVTLLLIEPILSVTGQSGSFFGAAIIAVILIAIFFIAAHIGFHLALKRVTLSGRSAMIDRAAGGAFGFFRGLVLIGLGYLGYSYYLDEAKQPDSVRSAITQPVAAGMAHWFESFTPETADLDAPVKPVEDDVDASISGYERSDRSNLNEIVTTVTTTDPAITESQPDEGAVQDDDGDEDDDPIADILNQDDNQ
ncbi:CvpA family protein [Hyphococcus sp.]|uniref:CvpA family protein n=1 Tax=Hyphococcus sp. TaxID=2038636 RepID=UPI00207F7984|nr:MAG: hypothetical protein DHS20C04_27180 [Marinicaulis sp.]